MEAYYYCIYKISNNERIIESIVRHSEDIIYPGQETMNPDLPSECEAHHFNAPRYKLTGWYFNIP